MFSVKDIPNLQDKIVLITGGSGIGLEIAKVLREKGANVYVASRNIDKTNPHNIVLDLADLQSVLSFDQRFLEDRIDILICNAGMMPLAERRLSADGYEMCFATNHLGHFALVNLLLPKLLKSQAPRLIVQSSLMAYKSIIDFDDLQCEKSYKPMRAYSQSKFCNVLFANEIAHRYPDIISVAVHPGGSNAGMQNNINIPKWILIPLLKIAGQPLAACALPALYASTQSCVVSGQFFGPKGMFHKGGATLVKMPKGGDDRQTCTKLWDISQTMIDKEIDKRVD